MASCWLLKTEPTQYSYDDLRRDGQGLWDGVRNPQAQVHLRAMAPGDRAIVYHTGRERAAVGVAQVAGAPGPDPSEPGLAAVPVRPVARLPRPVPLSELKGDPVFEGSPLVRQGRLSVVPLSDRQCRRVLELGRAAGGGGGAVRRGERELWVDLPTGPLRLPAGELPGPLLDWLDAGRRQTYRALSDGEGGAAFFAQHLPVLVTRREGAGFPFGCANKGVGYLPRPERVEEFSTLYRQAAEGARGRPARDSLRERLAAAAHFGFDRQALDPRCLGTLEIFEGSTLENLRRYPLAALLFTGHGPGYLSYQVDCAVEIVEAGEPRFEFLRLARTLFEYDGFHIAQPRFRYAYVFWVSEARDKTPHRVRAAGPCGLGPAALPWDDAALASLGGVPTAAREEARRAVEGYAGERGFPRVTLELAVEALRALRLAASAPSGRATEGG
ncbi:MAG: EVE domain-containing protein [Deferrisomatales bacterium]